MTEIVGRATAQGTGRFAARFKEAAPGHFRSAQGWTVSSVGLGTYPGGDDEDTDAGYGSAVELAVRMGCNVIDTAVAYRNQRSERAIGKALNKLIAEGTIGRDEIIISSKVGFVPFDSAFGGGVSEYFDRMFLRPGVVEDAEVVQGRHCLSPRFVLHQIDASRSNLNCERIDVYYLHNPETQLREVDRKEFRRRVQAAFETLEQAVEDGKISLYGASAWSGFRAAPNARDYLSLSQLVDWAVEVGGQDHHFKAVLVPLNLAVTDAYTFYNQELGKDDAPVTLLEAARALGMTVMAGSSLNGARLVSDLPADLRVVLNGESGLKTDAQRALQFTRSVPGVVTALFGTANPVHLREDLQVARASSLSADAFRQLFDG